MRPKPAPVADSISASPSESLQQKRDQCKWRIAALSMRLQADFDARDVSGINHNAGNFIWGYAPTLDACVLGYEITIVSRSGTFTGPHHVVLNADTEKVIYNYLEDKSAYLEAMLALTEGQLD